MPRYKVLKSVAHNVADSFVGALNYSQDGHVICRLLDEARATGNDHYFIDFRSGEHSQILDEPGLAKVVPFYSKMFWDNVERQGASRDFIDTARLSIRFNLNNRREVRNGYENPYLCRLDLVDNRGVSHAQELSGWWQPEPWLADAPVRWSIKRFIRRILG